METPYGFCQCGCGQRTTIAKTTHHTDGRVKGQPMRFIHNHHTKLSPDFYLVEDHGYKTPCWIWQGSLTTAGYGLTFQDGHKLYVHILHYERVNGPVPDEMELDHLCRIRCCCNPDHLEPVKRAVNVRRGLLAKLTLEQVREIRKLKSTGRTSASIASLFSVTRQTIDKVANNETWRE